jgi:molybdopterin molybdotransferase
MTAPRLKNDCFALPPGVNWTPVAEAQDRLRNILHSVMDTEDLPLMQAEGRFMAQDQHAQRPNPPTANSAVDGYGFAGVALGAGDLALPLVAGRSAAGVPYGAKVPVGHAIRILTGAQLPEGVDTVVMQEDVIVADGMVRFAAGLKQGANARAAGEDVATGEIAVPKGRRLRAQEIAILAAVGVHKVHVFKILRVGVLSTGDELCAVGQAAASNQIYDANRPMLLSLIARWGYEAVDLGHAPDDRDALRKLLDAASARVDVILTSGGASAGDEDHVSALLTETGTVELWRIAIKPGRPLALGLWQGVPVFGLPGNPVAAFVCTLIFAEPAFRLLGGGAWRQPTGFLLPAAFSKSKKAGRREYLRARVTDTGAVEVFKSEGSGRISGLAWADGLVELDDSAAQIETGDMVRYLPFASFGT